MKTPRLTRVTRPIVAALLALVALSPSAPGAQARAREQAQGCQAWPIGFHYAILTGLQPGDSTGEVRSGNGAGNFGWLRWADDTAAIPMNPNSEEYLAAELLNPSLAAIDFQNPQDPEDTSLTAGDWVWGLTGNVTSNGIVSSVLASLLGQEIRVVVWSHVQGTGSSVMYFVIGFARVRLDSFDLTGNPKKLWATFLGWDDDMCPDGTPDLVLAKTAEPPRVRPGGSITYTLAFSNAGTAPAAGVVITDAMPFTLAGVAFRYAGAAITPTAGTSYTWQVQDLAPGQGGVVTLTGRLPAGLPAAPAFTNTAAITGSLAESNATNNAGQAAVTWHIDRLHLPVILKQP
jgi:uncharacterized repeat protein (TIGR01451 family)